MKFNNLDGPRTNPLLPANHITLVSSLFLPRLVLFQGLELRSVSDRSAPTVPGLSRQLQRTTQRTNLLLHRLEFFGLCALPTPCQTGAIN